MATASQKIMLTRFLVLIRGALTPAPRILEPVVKIPLQDKARLFRKKATTSTAKRKKSDQSKSLVIGENSDCFCLWGEVRMQSNTRNRLVCKRTRSLTMPLPQQIKKWPVQFLRLPTDKETSHPETWSESNLHYFSHQDGASQGPKMKLDLAT